MESLRKRINVRLVHNEKDFLKYTRRPTHITHKIFEKNYAAISIMLLKKPIYVGFTVLELSKWLMYGFHYSFITKHFDAELLFTDRQSYSWNKMRRCLRKKILSTNICLISVTIQKIFNLANKKVIDKMKDESERKIIDEFVGLKSKWVNIATEFNKFKDILFKKKYSDTKWEEFKAKKT